MNLQSTFVNTLNQLLGQTVEIALGNNLMEAVISFAGNEILAVVELGTGGYGYGSNLLTTYIALSAVDFIRIL
ncbi:hypothetical protein C7445_11715 [Alicyclobacillus sacchari]|uniref:Uncharacterized protein n=1 Tax=Alicyclobacillus sacchari TaxID=392010 RepID=A0A4R8LGA4_9BACL|nr:hypothetical protein [Alicyclobacillus sacchari]TDY42166.1 hypothetical protein C7445_11715 [Alicyclobacillus sacchari]GMA58948.1 hypothetical protein GCM10025858_34510 [Alicyclobacillus sacchari]